MFIYPFDLYQHVTPHDSLAQRMVDVAFFWGGTTKESKPTASCLRTTTTESKPMALNIMKNKV